MKQIRWLLVLVFWTLAAEGVIGFSQSAAESNVIVTEIPLSEPNILELVAIEAVDVIELTQASNIIRPNFRLLPLKTELDDTASLPLLLEVFHTDPNQPESELDFKLVDKLLAEDADEVDMKVLNALLEQHDQKLDLLRRASLCKTVEWPVMHSSPYRTDGDMYLFAEFPSTHQRSLNNTQADSVILTASEYLDFLNDIQQYGKLIALKARSYILQRDYERAAAWLQVGLGICRQMVHDSNSHLGVMAAADAAVMLQQIELWIQTPDSPSLFRSLQDLPRPFLNALALQPLAERKPQPPKRSRYGRYGRARFPVPGNYNDEETTDVSILPDYSNSLFRSTADRIDRFIAILECLEGLRYYTTLYDGKLPESLTAVTEIRLPVDPITHQRFVYRKLSNAYVLETSDRYEEASSSGFSYTIQLDTF